MFDCLVPLLLICCTELLYLLACLLVSIVPDTTTTPQHSKRSAMQSPAWQCSITAVRELRARVCQYWTDMYQAAAPPNATAQARKFCERERPVPVNRRLNGPTPLRALEAPLLLLGKGDDGGGGGVEACDMAGWLSRL